MYRLNLGLGSRNLEALLTPGLEGFEKIDCLCRYAVSMALKSGQDAILSVTIFALKAQEGQGLDLVSQSIPCASYESHDDLPKQQLPRVGLDLVLVTLSAYVSCLQ